MLYPAELRVLGMVLRRSSPEEVSCICLCVGAPAIPIAAAFRLYDVGIRLSRRSDASRPSSGSRRPASVRRQPLTLERIPTRLKGLTFGSPCRNRAPNRDRGVLKAGVASTRAGRWLRGRTRLGRGGVLRKTRWAAGQRGVLIGCRTTPEKGTRVMRCNGTAQASTAHSISRRSSLLRGELGGELG